MLKKSLLLGSTFMMVAAAPAMAQVEDEIIVTATKRATTLQETPVAVAVTSNVEIERANILDINDLQSVVPSLRIDQLQSSQNTNFIIRGFGNGANNAGIEPSVGVFIDGVYRSRSAASINDLPKLERIEVLNGPQSTLFGKNASAGVISVVTAKPSYDPEAHVELGYGNYNQLRAKAYISAGNEAGTVAGSLGVGYNKRDGYFTPVDPSLENVNDRNRFNVRGQLLFEPTDNVEFRLIGDYSKLDENCCGVTNVVESVTSQIERGLGGANVLPDVSDPFTYVAFQNGDSVNELEDYGLSFHADVNLDKFDITTITSFRANDSFFDTDADYGRLAILDSVNSDQETKTFTQEIRLTSNNVEGPIDWMLGAYYFNEEVQQIGGLAYGNDTRRYIDALSGGALGLIEAANANIPAGSFFNADTTTTETFQQDNQAYSLFGTVDYHLSDRFTITGGLNYTNDAKDVSGSTVNNDTFSQVDLTGPEGFNSLVLGGQLANFGAFSQSCLDPNNPGSVFATPLAFNPQNIGQILGTQCFAAPGVLVPGSAAFNGFNQTVIGGVSALDLSDPAQNSLLGLRAFQFQPQFLAFPNAIESGQTRDDKLTWLARAAYEVNDNLNVYASVATGFKASSWNLARDSRPFPADAVALQGAGLTQINQGFGTRFAKPEEAMVYELGAKMRFDKGSLNVAVFDQTLTDFQQNAFVGAAFVLTNAGETNVKGAEWDLTYRPLEALSLNFAGTYLDAEYTDFKNATGPIPGVPVDLTGTRPSNIAEISLSLGGTYNHEFENGMSGYLRADWQYEGNTDFASNLSPAGLATRAQFVSIAATVDSFPGYESRSQSLVNASAGIDFDNGIGLQFWARNLFNDKYISTIFPGVAQEGIINGYPSPPRTYGVNARYKF